MNRIKTRTPAVRAFGTRRTNADLVADLATLQYLRPEWTTLDPTYGEGRWWTLWRPDHLITSDLHVPGATWAWDFTALPCRDRGVDAVVFDPPYKLNGTPSGGGPAASDAAYGVGRKATAAQRLALMDAGLAECARVAVHRLVVKCQDQVNSGHKVWQTHRMCAVAYAHGWVLDDMLHVQGYREQPTSTPCRTCVKHGHDPVTVNPAGPGMDEVLVCPTCHGTGRTPRTQQHAGADYSTALVFSPGGENRG